MHSGSSLTECLSNLGYPSSIMRIIDKPFHSGFQKTVDNKHSPLTLG